MQRNIKKRKASSPFGQEDTRGIDSKESKTNNPFSRGIRQKRSCFKMTPRAEIGKSAKGNRLTVRLLDNSFEQGKNNRSQNQTPNAFQTKTSRGKTNRLMMFLQTALRHLLRTGKKQQVSESNFKRFSDKSPAKKNKQTNNVSSNRFKTPPSHREKIASCHFSALLVTSCHFFPNA